MKRTYLLLFLFCSFVIINSSSAQVSDGPVATFNETSHNFGDLTQGDKLNHTFEFTNTGDQPIVISNVITTCGCTATKWTKKPVPPGKSGQVKITFDSSGKMGKQNKIITVVSNADPQLYRLSITASVLPGR